VLDQQSRQLPLQVIQVNGDGAQAHPEEVHAGHSHFCDDAEGPESNARGLEQPSIGGRRCQDYCPVGEHHTQAHNL